MQPTDEQVKEFWLGIFGKEGVEFGQTIGGKLVCYRRTKWIEADGEWGIEVIPGMDSLEFLGYLFKYAVPKFANYNMHKGLEPGKPVFGQHIAEVWSLTHGYGKAYSEDPALALFWAICKAWNQD